MVDIPVLGERELIQDMTTHFNPDTGDYDILYTDVHDDSDSDGKTR